MNTNLLFLSLVLLTVNGQPQKHAQLTYVTGSTNRVYFDQKCGDGPWQSGVANMLPKVGTNTVTLLNLCAGAGASYWKARQYGQ